MKKTLAVPLALILFLPALSAAEGAEAVPYEEYNPPLIATIHFSAYEWEEEEGEEVTPGTVEMRSSGTYTVQTVFPHTRKGGYGLSLCITNLDEESRDYTFLDGRDIRIETVKINGVPVELKTNYTGFLSEADREEGYGILPGAYLIATIYDGYGDQFYEYTCWNGDSIKPGESDINNIISPEDVASVDSIGITFTYGVFR